MKFKIFVLFFASILFSGCAMLAKKVDPAASFKTQTGFKFHFPMAGEWFEGESAQAQYMVGQHPGADGSSYLAMVRHGPIWTPGGKPMNHIEMLQGFQRDIEADSNGARVRKIKSEFKPQKFKNADCLFFDQTGIDQTDKGPMEMSYDGLICLHPEAPARFIWMALSERHGAGKTRPASWSDDKNKFFGSLEFIN